MSRPRLESAAGGLAGALVGLACSLCLVLGLTTAPVAGAQTGDAQPADEPADDQRVGWLAVWNVLGDADDAFEAGDWRRAEELYLRVVDGRPDSDDRRARGLLGAALSALARTDADPATARGHLETLLATYPDRDEAARARALQALVTDASTPRPAAPEPDPSLEEAPVVDEVAESAAAEDAARAAATERRLRRQVAALESELEATKAELAEKEAALERLKQAIVGGDG